MTKDEAMVEGCDIPSDKTIFCEYRTQKRHGSGCFIYLGTTLYKDSPQGHCYQHPDYQISRTQITRWRLLNFKENT